MRRFPKVEAELAKTEQLIRISERIGNLCGTDYTKKKEYKELLSDRKRYRRFLRMGGKNVK